MSIAIAVGSIPGWAAVRAIRFYQRHLSAHKGFVCAHRVLHGGDSCSEHGRKLIESHGVIHGLRQLRLRFQECRDARALLSTQRGALAAARVIDDEIDGASNHAKGSKRSQGGSQASSTDACQGFDASGCSGGPPDCGTCAPLEAIPEATGLAGDVCIGMGCDAAGGIGCEAIGACA